MFKHFKRAYQEALDRNKNKENLVIKTDKAGKEWEIFTSGGEKIGFAKDIRSAIQQAIEIYKKFKDPSDLLTIIQKEAEGKPEMENVEKIVFVSHVDFFQSINSKKYSFIAIEGDYHGDADTLEEVFETISKDRSDRIIKMDIKPFVKGD